MNFGLAIRIPDQAIRIHIPESVFRSENVIFGQAIRIPEVVIRIHIPKSFLNGEKVKICWAILIPKGAIRIPYVNAANKSRICIPIKKCIFLHDPDVFWIWLFLTKLKIRSKYFYGGWFQIVSRSFTTSKYDRKKLIEFCFQKAAKNINWKAIRIP